MADLEPVQAEAVWVLGVEGLVSGIAASVMTALQPLRDLLPGVNAGSLASAVMPDRPPGIAAPPGVTTSVAEGRAVTTVLCYLVVCFAVALWAARRRDVT